MRAICLSLLPKPELELVLSPGFLSMAVFLIKPVLLLGFKFKVLYKNTKDG